MAKRKFTAEPHAPKYRQVLESLAKDILSGQYRARAETPQRSGAGAAVSDLPNHGRPRAPRPGAARPGRPVAGSGTYVRQAHRHGDALLFGLLIPDLGRTEIFEPICRGIAVRAAGRPARAAVGPRGRRQPLGTSGHRVMRSIHRAPGGGRLLCAPGSTGGRPAPLETNLAIVARLEKARIPIVLLDRCVAPYPHRCRHDLVGIDNRRAGYLAAEHLLLAHGARRIAMIAYSGGAPDRRCAHRRLPRGGARQRRLARSQSRAPPGHDHAGDSVRPLLKGIDGVCLRQ